MVRKSRYRPQKPKALPPPQPEAGPKAEFIIESKAESKPEPKALAHAASKIEPEAQANAAPKVDNGLQVIKRSMRLPPQLKAAPLGSPTLDYSGVEFAIVPSLAAVVSKPTQALVGAKTGIQVGGGSRVFRSGGRVGLRVTRL